MAKNKEKTPPKSTTAATNRRERNRVGRALLALALILLIFVGILILGVFLKHWLFTGNQRLTLREVEVVTTGYWDGKAPQLANRLGIEPNSNLYTLRPEALRERLREIPSVESCEVRRILPDTLQLRIIERIPRAALGNPRSPWVVDQTGVVIPRLESMSGSSRLPLPVLIGVNTTELEPGQQLENIRPALDLIMLTVRNFPDIEVIAVDLRNQDKYAVFIRYRKQKSCKLLIPGNGKNYPMLLSAAQTSIIQAERRGDPRGTFDVSFDGRVVMP